MLTHKRIISNKAKSPSRHAKNNQLHKPFSTSWIKNPMSAVLCNLNPPDRQTNQAATPIITYRIDHTGANTQGAGAHTGWIISLYRSLAWIDAAAPIADVLKQINSQPDRPSNCSCFEKVNTIVILRPENRVKLRQLLTQFIFYSKVFF